MKWSRSFPDEPHSASWIDDYVDDHTPPLRIGASGRPTLILSTLHYYRGDPSALLKIPSQFRVHLSELERNGEQQDEESHQLHNHAGHEDYYITATLATPPPRRPPDIT